MLSYIVKMAEKRQEDVYLYMIGVRAESVEKVTTQPNREAVEILKQAIAKQITSADISIEYSNTDRLVIWFRVSKEAVEQKLQNIQGISLGKYRIAVKEVNRNAGMEE